MARRQHGQPQRFPIALLLIAIALAWVAPATAQEFRATVTHKTTLRTLAVVWRTASGKWAVTGADIQAGSGA